MVAEDVVNGRIGPAEIRPHHADTNRGEGHFGGTLSEEAEAIGLSVESIEELFVGFRVDGASPAVAFIGETIDLFAGFGGCRLCCTRRMSSW